MTKTTKSNAVKTFLSRLWWKPTPFFHGRSPRWAQEECPSLTDPVWTPTPQPAVDTATAHTVTVPAVGPMRYFRLEH